VQPRKQKIPGRSRTIVNPDCKVFLSSFQEQIAQYYVESFCIADAFSRAETQIIASHKVFFEDIYATKYLKDPMPKEAAMLPVSEGSLFQ